MNVLIDSGELIWDEKNPKFDYVVCTIPLKIIVTVRS